MKLLYKILIFSLLTIALIDCKKEKKHTISEIDKLNTEIKVQNFIRKLNSNYKDYEVKSISSFKRNNQDCKKNVELAEKLNISDSYYKTDFDNNGLTDLLVIGDDKSCTSTEDEFCSFTPIAIMNFGKKNYKILNISAGFDEYLTPKIEYKNGKNLLGIYIATNNSFSKKLLTYKFDDFLEYNSNDKNYIPIEKIEFSTSGCFGTCPVFEIIINKDQSATFKAEHFNFSDKMESYSNDIEGKFIGKIKEKDYENLINILQYIDFPNLEDNYSVNWTDDQTVNLKITYGNGKTKKINDYGAIGTYGLKKVYKMLFDFRKNQNWTKK